MKSRQKGEVSGGSVPHQLTGVTVSQSAHCPLKRVSKLYTPSFTHNLLRNYKIQLLLTGKAETLVRSVQHRETE